MGPDPVRFAGVDLAGLQRLARDLVESLPAGLTFGLVGTLGAGKTSWTQAVARAIGVDPREVTSPTFTLVRSHQPALPETAIRRMHHLDAYRVGDEDEFFELGVEELFADADAWTVVEWADRFPDAMPADTVWVRFDFEPDGHRRRLDFRTADVALLRRLRRLTASAPAPPRPPGPEKPIR